MIINMCKINRILKALSCSAPVTEGGVDLCPCVCGGGHLKCDKEKGPVVICRLLLLFLGLLDFGK